VDITNYTNSVLDAPQLTTQSSLFYFSNQKESYQTFAVRVTQVGTDPRDKLVIQTLFSAVTGTTAGNHIGRVYIRKGDLPMARGCNSYSCSWPSALLDCGNNWRYQNPSCSLSNGIFYIIVC
jgi:hypothetical protein